MDMDKITDVWFYCGLSLEYLATKLGLSNVYYDYENDWEWVTGYFSNCHLDITRIHWLEAADTETRIFLLGEDKDFNASLIDQLVERLKDIGIDKLHLGQWQYVSGEGFEQRLSETLA
jgi:hypothetical protein